MSNVNEEEERSSSQQDEHEEEESHSHEEDEDHTIESDDEDEDEDHSEDDSDEDEEEARAPAESAILRYLFHSVLDRDRGDSRTNQALVSHLRRSDTFRNPRVGEALLKLPRGSFLPENMQSSAYSDRPLRLSGFGFNISAPHMYAMCLENLNLQEGHRFLDIGCGTGHFTALGGYLVGKTGVSHGLDLRQDIIDFAKSNVKRVCEQSSDLNLSNVRFFVRNCFLADPDQQTYDRIHVGACCPTKLLNNLLELLRPNGILVTPYEDELLRVCKNSKGETKKKTLAAVRYGDLVVPSPQEMQAAQVAVQRKKTSTVHVPRCTFREDILAMLNQEKTADVTLCFEDGRVLHAHSFILQARSEHFSAMLCANMRESSSGKISVQVVDYKDMLTFLTYLYGGNIIIDEENAVGLLKASDYYTVPRLKCMCEDILSRMIDVDNAAHLLGLAASCNALQLKGVALEYAIDHYSQVVCTNDFKELDKDLLIEVTAAACRHLASASFSPPSTRHNHKPSTSAASESTAAESNSSPAMIPSAATTAGMDASTPISISRSSRSATRERSRRRSSQDHSADEPSTSGSTSTPTPSTSAPSAANRSSQW